MVLEGGIHGSVWCDGDEIVVLGSGGGAGKRG